MSNFRLQNWRCYKNRIVLYRETWYQNYQEICLSNVPWTAPTSEHWPRFPLRTLALIIKELKVNPLHILVIGNPSEIHQRRTKFRRWAYLGGIVAVWVKVLNWRLEGITSNHTQFSHANHDFATQPCYEVLEDV